MDFNQLKNISSEEWDNLNSENTIWIRVGYGASGQAAGAEEIFNLLKDLSSDNENIIISLVGSMGLSYAEPLIDIKSNDGIRVFYNNVTPDITKEIYNYLIQKNIPLSKYVFGQIVPNGRNPIDGIPELDKIEPLKYTKQIVTKNFGNISPTNIKIYISLLYNGETSVYVSPLPKFEPKPNGHNTVKAIISTF